MNADGAGEFPICHPRCNLLTYVKPHTTSLVFGRVMEVKHPLVITAVDSGTIVMDTEHQPGQAKAVAFDRSQDTYLTFPCEGLRQSFALFELHSTQYL